MVEIAVVNADALTQPCDLLVLKHANAFYGVDGAVANVVGFSAHVSEGGYIFVPGKRIEPKRVLFIGVGDLHDFRYEKIRAFGAFALNLVARELPDVQTICSPVHGPGCGLDDAEAFLSLVSGFFDAIRHKNVPVALRRIEIVERASIRAQRFQRLLSDLQKRSSSESARNGSEASSSFAIDLPVSSDEYRSKLSSFGSASERKIKLFVAMPFADDYSDIWDIAIQEACRAAGVVCEQVLGQAYVGDILQEIRKRVEESNGILALLDGANPNVFLELGYAWALKKPTILIASAGVKLPFDVQGQRCIIYTKLALLRSELAEELKQLREQGVFGRS